MIQKRASALPARKRPAHLPVLECFNRSNIIFVTVCTKDRRPLLANAAAHKILLASWAAASFFRVGRYVLMPDHVHLFCAPAANPVESLARWVRMWKSLSAKNWPAAPGVKLWQREFWDRQLRTGDSYSAKWEYVRQNPVRAGLARKPEDWPFQGEIHVLEWRE
jgi:REP element-mobilizing transposase RayT